MGEVHLAFDQSLQREVAIKRLDPGQVSPQLLTRFVAEVQITAQLDHPGVVPVHVLHSDEAGLPEYVMKVVRGDTLEQWMDDVQGSAQAGKRPPPGKDLRSRLEVFLDVCDTIEYAHSRQVVHRDLKPENIMIGPYRQVYVMDWGIAKLLGGGEAAATWSVGMDFEDETPTATGSVTTSTDGTDSTRFGSTLGTPTYMAPEQAKNAATVGLAADQFALGMLLQELVTLSRARKGGEGREVLGRAAIGERRPWKARWPGVEAPDDLRAIVERATQLVPGDRYASVGDMAADIRRYLRDEPTTVLPDGPSRRLTRWMSRHAQSVLIAGLAFAVVAGGIVAGVVVRGERSRAQERARAADREAQLTEHLVSATRRAAAIDTQLARHERVLTGLVFAAEHALANPTTPHDVYMPDAWMFPKSRPATAQLAPHYDNIASLDAPDFGFAPTADAGALTDHIQQLASLQPALRDALLDSHDDDARTMDVRSRDELVLERGVPILWSYVATEEGVIVGFPGTPDTYDSGYDPRTRPWYRLAATTPGPQWSALDVDESHMGLLLTASMAVRDGGRLLGVAGVDLTFGHVIDVLLAADAGADAEVFLVDGEGRVIVRSSQADAARKATEYSPEPFPWAPVVAELERREAGLLESDGRLFAWARLQTVGWSYVWVGKVP